MNAYIAPCFFCGELAEKCKCQHVKPDDPIVMTARTSKGRAAIRALVARCKDLGMIHEPHHGGGATVMRHKRQQNQQKLAPPLV